MPLLRASLLRSRSPPPCRIGRCGGDQPQSSVLRSRCRRRPSSAYSLLGRGRSPRGGSRSTSRVFHFAFGGKDREAFPARGRRRFPSQCVCARRAARCGLSARGESHVVLCAFGKSPHGWHSFFAGSERVFAAYERLTVLRRQQAQQRVRPCGALDQRRCSPQRNVFLHGVVREGHVCGCGGACDGMPGNSRVS